MTLLPGKRKARPAQGAQGRADSQAGSGTENKLECLSCVPCPRHREGGHPRAPHTKLPGRVKSGSEAGTEVLNRDRSRSRNWTPFPLRDQGQLETVGWGSELGRTDQTAGQMELACPVRWRPEDLPSCLPGDILSLCHSTSRTVTQVQGTLISTVYQHCCGGSVWERQSAFKVLGVTSFRLHVNHFFLFIFCYSCLVGAGLGCYLYVAVLWVFLLFICMCVLCTCMQVHVL